MRTRFISTLIRLAREHPNLFLVVGDLGYSVVEPFAREFPDRFLNAGVAEQNMTGVAAGLASEGYHVFTYSIANFPLLRCFEQIRNDVCHHRLPVTVVAVGGGLAYGQLGFSHHAVQDYGVARTLPELQVFCPGDPPQVESCLHALVARPGPSYLRLGKNGEPSWTEPGGRVDQPVAVVREPGARRALVCTGGILDAVVTAARRCRAEGLPLDVWALAWLTPDDERYFHPLAAYERLLVVEEHVAAGGLGEILAARLSGRTVLRSLALPPGMAHQTGSQEELRRMAGLDPQSIARHAALTD